MTRFHFHFHSHLHMFSFLCFWKRRVIRYKSLQDHELYTPHSFCLLNQWKSNLYQSNTQLQLQPGLTTSLLTYVLTYIWDVFTTPPELFCCSIHAVRNYDVLRFSVVDLNDLAWSVTMACYAHGAPITTVWTYVGLFLAAAQVFHAAGCVINDMWDKDIDAAVREFTLSVN